MSAEEDRIKENATTLAKVTTAIFPAEGLAPWMSHYDKKTQSLIIMAKTIADVTEELERQKWMKNHAEEVEVAETELTKKEEVEVETELAKKEEVEAAETELAKKEEVDLEEEIFDLSKLKGADYMYAFCMNSLASNLHNYAPSVEGIRTKQGIAMAKASNPGMAVVPDQQKKSLFQRMMSIGKKKDEAT